MVQSPDRALSTAMVMKSAPVSAFTTCMFSYNPAAIAAWVYSTPSQVSETDALLALPFRPNWNRLTPE